jgi:hypothetical protein
MLDLAQEKVEYFKNNPQARKIWTDEECEKLIDCWQDNVIFYKKLLAEHCDHDCKDCKDRIVVGDEEHCLQGEEMG